MGKTGKTGQLHQILSDVPESIAPENNSPMVNLIRFRLEPFIEYSLYTIGMLTIVIGAVNAIIIGVRELREKKLTYDERTSKMRIQLSESIALGITFILGAEVVKSFRIPTFMQLIKVSILVLLRQLITYFLDQDVARLRAEFPNIN